MNNRKRNVQIKFRVTKEERSLIEEKMKQVPTSNMEAYLRKMAINGYIIQVDHSDIKKMTAELQRIGININQIARRANATENVYQEDIEEIKGALKEIWRLQRLRLLGTPITRTRPPGSAIATYRPPLPSSQTKTLPRHRWKSLPQLQHYISSLSSNEAKKRRSLSESIAFLRRSGRFPLVRRRDSRRRQRAI